jgi:hypothetical protein
VTIEEIGKLLAVCASFDKRKVDEVDVIAWGEALGGQISFAEARENVIRYYRYHRVPVMPSDILHPSSETELW